MKELKKNRILHILSNDKERRDAIFVNGTEDYCSSTSSLVVSLEMAAAGKPMIWKGYIKGSFYIKGFAVRNNSDYSLKHTLSYFSKGLFPRESRKFLVKELRNIGYSLDTETYMTLNKKSFRLFLLSIINYLIK